MLYHLMIASVGIVGLLTLWLGIQFLARRQRAGDCEGPGRQACDACEPGRAGTCGMRWIQSDTE